MIYTVTTNPNIDYYMDLRAPLRVGGINRSGRELLAPGGKGINVSLMLSVGDARGCRRLANRRACWGISSGRRGGSSKRS